MKSSLYMKEVRVLFALAAMPKPSAAERGLGVVSRVGELFDHAQPSSSAGRGGGSSWPTLFVQLPTCTPHSSSSERWQGARAASG